MEYTYWEFIFAYGEKQILRDINLNIKSGENTGIVGVSGMRKKYTF